MQQPEAPANSFHPKTRADWRAWLAKNHGRGNGIWVITFKKSTGLPTVKYDELVEEALCFGWIDSKPRKLDESRSMLWFAPRRPGTGWSRLNKARVNKLIASGLMTTAGLELIQRAHNDGSWNSLDAVESLTIPADLKHAFGLFPHAFANFENFPRSAKRAILEWISAAKKPETRTKRIQETARLAEKNLRANQWRPRS